MTTENLLQLIKTNPDHPFNFLDISDDFTKIRTFNNKEKTIYANKKRSLEVLACEIFSNTYLRDEMSYYIDEENDGEENFRSDLIARLYGDNTGKQNIIEFKEMDSNISAAEYRNQVDNAFSQVKHKYITEKDGDIFVSVVCMDVEKIVNNPINLEKFITMQDHEKMKAHLNKNESQAIFKKFGISIITKKYEAMEDNYSSDRIWFHIPKNCLIEVDYSECDLFDLPQKVSNVKDAIKFPTTSSCYGIKNVRDIKDPATCDQKRNLLLEITSTVAEAFNKNSPSLINKYGKEKDFVFIRDESIVKKYKHKDVQYYSLTTMNGSIVDGQNSIHCFKLILEFLESVFVKKSDEYPKYYEKMENILKKNNISNVHKRTELKKFIENLKITIKTTETSSVDEAMHIAVNKNNTMPVKSNELIISRNSERIYIIGNAILEKSEIILGYPKRQFYGVSNEQKKNHVIDCEFLAKANLVYKEILEDKNFAPDKVFAFKNKMLTSNAKKAITEFCEDFSKPVVDNELITVKKIEERIKDIQNDIESDNKVLAHLRKYDDPEVETYELAIKEKKKLLKENQKQRDIELIKTYEACNVQELINVSNVLLKIRYFIENLSNYIPQDVIDAFKIKKDQSIECYCFVLLVQKVKTIKNIKDDTIRNVVVHFCNNYHHFVKNYPAINITAINHNKNADAITTDTKGNIVYLKDITKDLFDISDKKMAVNGIKNDNVVELEELYTV